MAFPNVSSCVLLKTNYLSKLLATVFTTEWLFPFVKHHVIVKSRFGGICLSTLNKHTDGSLYLVECPRHVSIKCALPFLIYE